jgi:hypothetical protein
VTARSGVFGTNIAVRLSGEMQTIVDVDVNV